MTPAQAAEARDLAAQARAVADEMDAWLAAEGYPTSTTDAEIIAFPAATWPTAHGGRPAGLDGDAEVIDFARRPR